MNVSPVTINRTVDALHHQLVNYAPKLPTALSFDEVRTTNHQMSFIAIDAQTSKISTFLPGRKSQDVISYFERHYSLTERQAVKSIVIGFNAAYQSFIKRVFPNAIVVADRFHLVQMLERVINQARVQLMRQYDSKSYEYRLLKHHWKLFLKHPNALETKKPQWFTHLRNHLTQEQLIETALGFNQEFAVVYATCHGIIDALKLGQNSQVTDLINHSQTVNIGLSTVLSTLKKNLKAVCEAICSLLSNGRIEGVNRKIKQIIRTAYGYRNWQHLRDRIMIEFSLKTKKERPIRK
ncbi:ISL3 family transposase [Dellaglioa sp. P0083]|uniref:ISL3 family transposase n=1 Tax=Dellaglioa kimchii TaxID=3344667 RepID=UPI0038D3A4D8